LGVVEHLRTLLGHWGTGALRRVTKAAGQVKGISAAGPQRAREAGRRLAAAVDDPAFAEVVGGDLHRDGVAGDDADEVLAHPPGRRPPPSLRGRASLTVSGRPRNSAPLRASIAFWASLSSLISTNPKPRDRPVSRSMITWARATAP